MNTSWKQTCTCKSHNIKQVWNTKTSNYHTTATPHYYRKTFCSYSYILVVHFTKSTIWGLQKLGLVGMVSYYWLHVPNYKKIFSNVVVTSNSSCVFLYLFSSVNISPVRFVLHLQDWWCVGKRETSFPVNKLWLIYFPPSLWPLTMKNRYACKF